MPAVRGSLGTEFSQHDELEKGEGGEQSNGGTSALVDEMQSQ